MATANNPNLPQAPVNLKAVSAENPFLKNLPKIPTLEEARKHLLSFRKPGRSTDGQQSAEDSELAARLLIPTDIHSRILADIMELVWASYVARNPLECEYRGRAADANAFLRERPRNPVNPESRPQKILSVPKKSQKSRHDLPRGYIVCAPAQCGRMKLADAIEEYLDKGAKKETGATFEQFLIKNGDCNSQFIRIRTLRVAWPLDGRLKSFLYNMFCAVNAALGPHAKLDWNTRYCASEPHIEAALCAHGVAINLGLLVVEKIDTGEATSERAMKTWSALGRFTRTTGIPVVCFVTPGALTGLAKQGSAIGSLCPTGPRYIRPFEQRSNAWKAVVNAIYASCFPLPKAQSSPCWLYDDLWNMTFGHPGLAVCACRAVSEDVRSKKMTALEQGHFRAVAAQALTVYVPHLKAIVQMHEGGTFSISSLLRHGDWLTFEFMVKVVPSLEYSSLLPSQGSLVAS